MNTVCELGAGGVSIMSMAEKTLGKYGTRAASLAYLLIHYALLVAYTSKSGEIISKATGMEQTVASVLFATTLGGFCYKSSTKQMDLANSTLLLGVIASFLALVIVALPNVKLENLAEVDWQEVPSSLPVIGTLCKMVLDTFIPLTSLNSI